MLKLLISIFSLCIVGYYYNDFLFRKIDSVVRIRCSNDSNASCPENKTCCKAEVGWRCCNGKNAVCCSDLKSCCGDGDVCDLKEMVCRIRPKGHPIEKTDL